MISSFRNFAKTKFAGILVFIMIIPFVFWGMGSMFSSGNTNTIAKINESNISTEEFIDITLPRLLFLEPVGPIHQSLQPFFDEPQSSLEYFHSLAHLYCLYSRHLHQTGL